MKQEYIDGTTALHYPDTVIFTGGVNSYISITKPKSGAECVLLAEVGSRYKYRVQLKRTSVKGRDIIFPLSDISTALWGHLRDEYPEMFTPIDSRKFYLNINISYDNRIHRTLNFILINGSPNYDVISMSSISDRRRGVFWKNDYEIFEVFGPTKDGEQISRVKVSWSTGNKASECNISNPFINLSTTDIETPPDVDGEVLLCGDNDPNADNIIINSNFEDGREDWLDWGDPVTREIVELDGKNWAHIKTSAAPWQGYMQTRYNVISPNTTYTLSFTARVARPGQVVGIGIQWFRIVDGTPPKNMILSQSWEYWQIDTTPKRLIFKNISPDNCSGVNLLIGNGGGVTGDTAIATEVWITDIKLENGDNDNPVWTPAYPIFRKEPLYIDMCPLSKRDMQLNWFDELGVLCSWRFTEEYNETSVTTDATLTRMEVSDYSLYQSRTRMTRRQTTHTLHSRKVPRDVVPFIKSILSAPVVWRYNGMDETMIVEDYKEKDYGRGYVDVVIKVTDTPRSYE